MSTTFPKNGDLPSPLGTLSDLLEVGDQNSVPLKVFIGHNLGARTFLLCIPMHKFFDMSKVANQLGAEGEPVTQRKLDEKHAEDLAKYMLRGLLTAAINYREMQGKVVPPAFLAVQSVLGKQPYLSLQPLVVNLRSCKPAGANLPGERLITHTGETASFRVMLSQRDILWVVDGQHRREGMSIVFDFLKSVRNNQRYPKKGSLYQGGSEQISAADLQVWQECDEVARGFCTVAVEVHLGLDHKQERQIFHDLNNLGKKVERSLALVFDGANPVNAFIKEVLDGRLVPLSESDQKDWKKDDGSLSYKEVAAVNAHLFLNKSNIGGAVPNQVGPKLELATRFWETIAAIPDFGEPHAKEKTVAAQPVVLKALAKLVFDFAWGRRRNADHLETLLSGITDVDFSHDNPMWRFYQLSDSERAAAGLSGMEVYLPSSTDGTNRDVGAFQGEHMRFGAKHNDIFPIIGDMIRWKLGLPSRHELVEQ